MEAQEGPAPLRCQFLDRLLNLPIVISALDLSTRVYQRSKQSNVVVGRTVSLAAGSFAFACCKAKSLIKKLEGPARAIALIRVLIVADYLAVKALEKVEAKVPTITQPTDQVLEVVFDYANNMKVRIAISTITGRIRTVTVMVLEKLRPVLGFLMSPVHSTYIWSRRQVEAFATLVVRLIWYCPIGLVRFYISSIQNILQRIQDVMNHSLLQGFAEGDAVRAAEGVDEGGAEGDAVRAAEGVDEGGAEGDAVQADEGGAEEGAEGGAVRAAEDVAEGGAEGGDVRAAEGDAEGDAVPLTYTWIRNQLEIVAQQVVQFIWIRPISCVQFYIKDIRTRRQRIKDTKDFRRRQKYYPDDDAVPPPTLESLDEEYEFGLHLVYANIVNRILTWESENVPSIILVLHILLPQYVKLRFPPVPVPQAAPGAERAVEVPEEQPQADS